MSQQQSQRPQAEGDPIKYGDVFYVKGDLSSKPIKPQDATSMQAAENRVLGETPSGGPASVMQSAARVNVRSGLVDPDEPSEVIDKGFTVSETDNGSERIITERVAGQVVVEYVEQKVPVTTPGSLNPDAITIGEALEATALSAAGNKPVDQGDAAAIQAAEVRATGINEVLPGGVGAQAQSAATTNITRAIPDQDKTTLADVKGDATIKLPADKPVMREDAEGVIGAEVRNKPNMSLTPGGVARSMAAAARLNQNKPV